MGPVLRLSNITILVAVVFEDVLAMIRLRQESNCAHMNVVISNIQMQMICDTCIVWKMEFSCKFHTRHT